ncbi:aminoglycoside phosphotransferase family protein [Halomonas sp. hl-4]|uniref:aminoglycoside phosphotransferase family protein n=1 Tax=Halomonas sp. hl-4 TaxID=1761789 RepID=UPI000BB6B070|nr:phosphotransferase [Halomonas sp. hl-4]SNY98909.1 hypothetical protein SAMN04488142_3542 [Halomonas sp. hl-4]
MSSSRINALIAWAAHQNGLPVDAISLAPAGGDASFRRYFRLSLPDDTTQVVMDAPPQQEDSQPFVTIARRWHCAGLPVPQVHAADLEQGFLLLDDLGSTPLQQLFTDDARIRGYHNQALSLIADLQNRVSPETLPVYDTALLGRELDLFSEWCLTAWLGLAVPDSWMALRSELIDQALAQPVVCVHRDFDAMNLMVHDQRLFIIDFQDAVAGPISYDVISLLRGRYQRFSEKQFTAFVDAFHSQAQRDGRLSQRYDAATFLHQCQAMAAQRTLKVLGIFCRLTLRDHKTGYLARLPHFLDHLDDSLAGIPGHDDFVHWAQDTLRPAIIARLNETDV